MNNPLPVVFECNDVSEKIDFYETYVSIFYKKFIFLRSNLDFTVCLNSKKLKVQRKDKIVGFELNKLGDLGFKVGREKNELKRFLTNLKRIKD